MKLSTAFLILGSLASSSDVRRRLAEFNLLRYDFIAMNYDNGEWTNVGTLSVTAPMDENLNEMTPSERATFLSKEFLQTYGGTVEQYQLVTRAEARKAAEQFGKDPSPADDTKVDTSGLTSNGRRLDEQRRAGFNPSNDHCATHTSKKTCDVDSSCNWKGDRDSGVCEGTNASEGDGFTHLQHEQCGSHDSKKTCAVDSSCA